MGFTRVVNDAVHRKSCFAKQGTFEARSGCIGNPGKTDRLLSGIVGVIVRE